MFKAKKVNSYSMAIGAKVFIAQLYWSIDNSRFWVFDKNLKTLKIKALSLKLNLCQMYHFYNLTR